MNLFSRLSTAAPSRRLVLASLVAGTMAVGAVAVQAAEPAMKPSGTITIDQTQFGFILSGQVGGGKLKYGDLTYPFSIGGLGLGTVGYSSVEAVGTVYDLHNIKDFSGLYGTLTTGASAGSKGSGEILLRNDKGVSIRLHTKQQGLSLTAGGSGVTITLK